MVFVCVVEIKTKSVVSQIAVTETAFNVVDHAVIHLAITNHLVSHIVALFADNRYQMQTIACIHRKLQLHPLWRTGGNRHILLRILFWRNATINLTLPLRFLRNFSAAYGSEGQAVVDEFLVVGVGHLHLDAEEFLHLILEVAHQHVGAQCQLAALAPFRTYGGQRGIVVGKVLPFVDAQRPAELFLELFLEILDHHAAINV